MKRLDTIVQAFADKIDRICQRSPDSFLTEFFCWRLRKWFRSFAVSWLNVDPTIGDPLVYLTNGKLNIVWKEYSGRRLHVALTAQRFQCIIELKPNQPKARLVLNNLREVEYHPVWEIFVAGSIPESLKDLSSRNRRRSKAQSR